MKFKSIYIEANEEILNDIIDSVRADLGNGVNAIMINPKLADEEEDSISTKNEVAYKDTCVFCGEKINEFTEKNHIAGKCKSTKKVIGCGQSDYNNPELCRSCGDVLFNNTIWLCADCEKLNKNEPEEIK